MTEPTLNAAQLQVAEKRAQEMTAIALSSLRLRQWAVEIAFKNRLPGDTMKDTIDAAAQAFKFVAPEGNGG